ncbi:MAG: YraN family protein [Aliishimia sp.]
MPLDECPKVCDPSTQQSRHYRGAMAHARGQAAEAQVARVYTDQGLDILCMRWRGKAGEIDLIVQGKDEIICVEVKSSKTHAQAAEKLSYRQISRLMLAAEEFIGTQPLGSLTPTRMDVALVDDHGRIDILENALMGA